jgi:hypothetical protein
MTITVRSVRTGIGCARTSELGGPDLCVLLWGLLRPLVRLVLIMLLVIDGERKEWIGSKRWTKP